VPKSQGVPDLILHSPKKKIVPDLLPDCKFSCAKISGCPRFNSASANKPESRDLASEWLPFSSHIALIWLQFGFNTAFSEYLGLLPDCYQIAVLCHLAAKRFFSFASAWLQFCVNFASVLIHFGFLRSNAIFIVCSRWLSFASTLLQFCFNLASFLEPFPCV